MISLLPFHVRSSDYTFLLVPLVLNLRHINFPTSGNQLCGNLPRKIAHSNANYLRKNGGYIAACALLHAAML